MFISAENAQESLEMGLSLLSKHCLNAVCIRFGSSMSTIVPELEVIV